MQTAHVLVPGEDDVPSGVNRDSGSRLRGDRGAVDAERLPARRAERIVTPRVHNAVIGGRFAVRPRYDEIAVGIHRDRRIVLILRGRRDRAHAELAALRHPGGVVTLRVNGRTVLAVLVAMPGDDKVAVLTGRNRRRALPPERRGVD